jgi:hypothetical protein
MDRPLCPVRRRLLGSAVALVAVAAGAAANAQHKATKAEAKYQDHPNDIQMCASCTQFVKPNACKVVDGEIGPDGWCRLFDMVD